MTELTANDEIGSIYEYLDFAFGSREEHCSEKERWKFPTFLLRTPRWKVCCSSCLPVPLSIYSVVKYIYCYTICTVYFTWYRTYKNQWRKSKFLGVTPASIRFLTVNYNPRHTKTQTNTCVAWAGSSKRCLSGNIEQKVTSKDGTKLVALNKKRRRKHFVASVFFFVPFFVSTGTCLYFAALKSEWKASAAASASSAAMSFLCIAAAEEGLNYKSYLFSSVSFFLSFSFRRLFLQ